MDTMAQIETQRDDYYPLLLKRLRRRLEILRSYANLGPEQARQATRQIFGFENSLKALTGRYNGLLDKKLMAKRQQEEKDFRGLVESKPELQQEYGSAWGVIAEAEKKSVETLKQRVYRSVSSASPLAGLALTIVQYVAEVKKPDGQRLDGFHDSELESLRFRMFSPAPVYPQMEEALLSGGLKESQEGLGADDPFVKTALDGHAPTDVAKRVITGT